MNNLQETGGRELKGLSGFSGILGFEVAAQMLGGFNFTQAIEINPFCQQVIKTRFPQLKIHDDIKTFKTTEPFDIFCFGSPCQDLSSAGVRKGITGSRSVLFFDALRIAEESQIDFLVWENVAGAINRGLRAVLGAFEVAGYTPEVEVISIANCGAPHRRERVFVVAYSSRVKQSFGCRVPTPWSRQTRSNLEIVADPSSFRLSAQPQPRSLPGEDGIPSSGEGQGEEGAFDRSGRPVVSCGEGNTRGTQLSSSPTRMAHGISAFLDGLRTAGYWDIPEVRPTQITAPRCSVPDRRKRISALGNAVSPLQAMLPLMRVKYLDSLRFY